jgi:DNA-binding MarR family transcriptional regulator
LYRKLVWHKTIFYGPPAIISTCNRIAPVSRQTTRARKTKPRRSPDVQTVDFGPLAGWIGFHLRMAQIASFQSFARRARNLDVSPGRFAALMVIGRNPGISQTMLSRSIGSDKSTLTPALDGLVRRGLVQRNRTPEDRRTYSLSLTPEGKHMLNGLTQCAQWHDRNLDRIVGPRDRARFLTLLRKIAQALD